MLALTKEQLLIRAKMLQELLSDGEVKCTQVDSINYVGGGAAPDYELSGVALKIDIGKNKGEDLNSRLLKSDTPVVAVLKEGAVFLEMRTLADDQLGEVARVLLDAMREIRGE